VSSSFSVFCFDRSHISLTLFDELSGKKKCVFVVACFVSVVLCYVSKFVPYVQGWFNLVCNHLLMDM